MGADVSVEVEGLAEVRKALRRAAPELRKDMNRDLRSVGDDVLETARGLAPARSERLRRSLKVVIARDGVAIQAGRAKVPYAGPIHFGWPGRPNKAKRWRGGPIAPQPFLYDAVDRRRSDVERRFEKLAAKWSDDLNRKL